MTETEHYRAHGYVALKALFPTELLSAFYGRMTDDLAAAGRSMASFKTRGPLQRDEAIEIYAYQYAPMLAFLWGVTPRMAQLTGLGLLPTYAYFRAYRVGDVCRVHSDRPACEHSLSLTLASGEDRPWSLSVATGRTDQPRPIVSDDFEGAAFESVDMLPGNGVAYQGTHRRHGRLDPNPNSWSVHLFMHWVEQGGRYADQAFDRPTMQAAGMTPNA